MDLRLLTPIVLISLASCEEPIPQDAGATDMVSVPLYTDLGTHSYPVTANAEAQRYFDQGLRLTYAFNHAEAIRAFNEAARLDQSCAMCYWGVAYAYGPNINAAMDSAAGVAAYAAVETALRLAPEAGPVERALIDALSRRYSAVPIQDRAQLDSAYAAAMGSVRDQYPEDLEVLTLHAESLMDLSPWNYWNADGTPRSATSEVLANLETVIALEPNHPGACHFYIHAVEATQPERAVECAERLADLMPGAGHLVHMPGHIYIRVGRYMDAIRANEHAVHADETFIRDQRPEVGVYMLGYYPHNYDFLSFAASMAGRSGQAMDAATQLASVVPEELLRVPGMGFLQQGMTGSLRTMVRFGQWDAIMSHPEIPEDLPYARGTWHYARGIAAASLGELDVAATELNQLRTLAELPELDELIVGYNSASNVLAVAAHVLAGEVAAKGGDMDAAVSHLEAGVMGEDAFVYGEPPDWPVPVRHHLGSVLLEAGRPVDAERVYREDLARFPENGWSLHGLAESLEAQGRSDEGEEVMRRFEAAWADSDSPIPGSRL